MKQAILINESPLRIKSLIEGISKSYFDSIIRKSGLKCELPIDVYIYCKKGRGSNLSPSLCVCSYAEDLTSDITIYKFYLKGKRPLPADTNLRILDGKIIGKFTLMEIEKSKSIFTTDDKTTTTWYFENFKFFDNPMELNDFWLECDSEAGKDCKHCSFLVSETNESVGHEEWCNSEHDHMRRLKRAPSNYQYVWVEKNADRKD